MATKLIKPVSREIEIKDGFGNQGQAIVTISQTGIEIRKKGTARKLHVEWNKLNEIFELPLTAPARFAGNPLGWIVEK